jgi:hypothetical protein
MLRGDAVICGGVLRDRLVAVPPAGVKGEGASSPGACILGRPKFAIFILQFSICNMFLPSVRHLRHGVIEK